MRGLWSVWWGVLGVGCILGFIVALRLSGFIGGWYACLLYPGYECVRVCVSVTNWVDWRVILDERCVSVESEVQWPEMASREVG